jgi:hypothetical protein
MLRYKKEILVTLMLALAFLVGFLPQYSERQRLEYNNKKISTELQIVRLRGELAMIAYQVEKKNFIEASERSTSFFKSLEQQIARTESKRRKDRLTKIAGSQKEIAELLEKNDKTAAERLAQLYQDLYEVTEPLPERLAQN